MFGNKKDKQERWQMIQRLVQVAQGGISQAELARRLNVSRATITKDLGVIERELGVLFWEDDREQLNWFE